MCDTYRTSPITIIFPVQDLNVEFLQSCVRKDQVVVSVDMVEEERWWSWKANMFIFFLALLGKGMGWVWICLLLHQQYLNNEVWDESGLDTFNVTVLIRLFTLAKTEKYFKKLSNWSVHVKWFWESNLNFLCHSKKNFENFRVCLCVDVGWFFVLSVHVSATPDECDLSWFGVYFYLLSG